MTCASAPERLHRGEHEPHHEPVVIADGHEHMLELAAADLLLDHGQHLGDGRIGAEFGEAITANGIDQPLKQIFNR